MLCLGRKVGESIVISDNIRVTVLSVSRDGSCCRIGVDCPREIPVHREEVAAKIAADAAAKGAKP